MHAGNAPFSQSEGDAGILKPVGVREKHKVIGGEKAWRWPRFCLYARAWPLVETRLRLCLDVNTSNSDVLSKKVTIPQACAPVR